MSLILESKKNNIIIARKRPNKKMALLDYLDSYNLKVKDGIYIGNETYKGGIDYPILDIKNIKYFAVDKQYVTDSRAIYVGNGPDGTADILKTIIQINDNQLVSSKNDFAKDLYMFLPSEEKKNNFIAIDIDDTILARLDDGTKGVKGTKERLDVHRKKILDSLVYLIKKDIYVCFITKNGGPITHERISVPLISELEAFHDHKITFYTSAMMKKSFVNRCGNNDLNIAIGKYNELNSIPKEFKMIAEEMCQKIKDAKFYQTEGLTYFKNENNEVSEKEEYLFEIIFTGM